MASSPKWLDVKATRQGKSETKTDVCWMHIGAASSAQQNSAASLASLSSLLQICVFSRALPRRWGPRAPFPQPVAAWRTRSPPSAAPGPLSAPCTHHIPQVAAGSKTNLSGNSAWKRAMFAVAWCTRAGVGGGAGGGDLWLMAGTRGGGYHRREAGGREGEAGKERGKTAASSRKHPPQPLPSLPSFVLGKRGLSGAGITRPGKHSPVFLQISTPYGGRQRYLSNGTRVQRGFSAVVLMGLCCRDVWPGGRKSVGIT